MSPRQAQQFLAPDFSQVERRPRISMRDPQQGAVNSAYAPIDLPVFEQPETFDPEAEVRRILAEAHATAESMIEQTRAAMEAEVDAARAAGYAAGHAEGLDSADRESAALIATAEQIASNVAAERVDLLARAEGEIVDLALAIAGRLVNASIDINPELVVDVCRGAMRKAFQRETLIVLAHPEDLELLRAAGPEMARELGGVHQLDFVEERRLQRGSVIVRTPVGEIDATFDAKGEKVQDGLRELVEGRRAERRNPRPTA